MNLFNLSPTRVRTILLTAAGAFLPGQSLSEPGLAAYLVYQDCLGFSDAFHCPFAQFLRKCGVWNARVFGDYITYGICLPWGSPTHRPYLISFKIALPDRLQAFQKNAWRYPILYDPSAPRDLAARLSFVLSAIGRNEASMKACGQMIFNSIRRGEVSSGGALDLKVDPTQFDKGHVDDLLQSLADTPLPKDS